MTFMQLAFLASAAWAGGEEVVAGCYSDAEAAYTGEIISVYVNQVQVVSNSDDLDEVFEGVAAAASSDVVSIVRNTAGENAMRQAMDCIFDAEMITWSAVRLNQQDNGLAVRDHSFRLVEDDVTTWLDIVELKGVGTSVQTIHYRLDDPYGTSCRTAAFEVVSLGSTSDYFASGFSGPGHPSATNTCKGTNCSKCEFEPEDGCDCTRLGPNGPPNYCDHTVTEEDADFSGSTATASISF